MNQKAAPVAIVQVGQRLQLFTVPTSTVDVRRYFGLREDVGKLLSVNKEEVDVLGNDGPYTLDVDLALVSKNKQAASSVIVALFEIVGTGTTTVPQPKKRGRPPKQPQVKEEGTRYYYVK
jgi:hypothetical protein